MSFVPAPPRRRPISSCLPCYNRKQKCNREIPCNHCSRRRCVESCVYYANPGSSSATSPSASSASSTSTTAAPVAFGVQQETPRRSVKYHGKLVTKYVDNNLKFNTSSYRRRSGGWAGRDLPRNEFARWGDTAGTGAGAGQTGAGSYTGPISGSARSQSWTNATETLSGRTLVESFGYCEASKSNTLALIQKLGLGQDSLGPGSSPVLVPEAAVHVHRVLCDIPDRQIIDFLVQFFVREISWMDQFIHVPWLVEKYQKWCNTRSAEECTTNDMASHMQQLRVVDVDFVVLMLRIVSYALQFLPSPVYPLDKIRGVLLADVRNECDDIADTLEDISWAHDGRGSLLRVQQLAFCALKHQTEGNINACLEIVSRAIRMAQSIGIHGNSVSAIGADETEREMARRTFCNLYAWDSLLSRQLDRMHAFPVRLHPQNWPRLHELSDSAHHDREQPPKVPLDPCLETPDPFTERLLQARLADFWRSVTPTQAGDMDDIMAAEERYNRFTREFLSQLPPVFALAGADESWDKMLPKLPLQRQLLHIAIYDSLCWNFRPLLFRNPSSSLSLPPYKALLLSSQKRGIAGAALRSLDGVTRLHALLGGCHTRLSGIVMSTFEAAVLLLQLCADPSFAEDNSCLNMYQHQQKQQQHITPQVDPLRANLHMVDRSACMEAVEGAVKRLKMLSDVSSMADIGARTLVELLERASSEKAGGIARERERRRHATTSNHPATTMDTIHVATQSYGLVHDQGQEAESMSAGSLHNSPRTTTSSLTGETVVGDGAMVMSWNTESCDDVVEELEVALSMDMPSLQDFISMDATMAVEDMAAWSAFDASSVFPQDSEYPDDAVTTCK